MKSLEDLMKIRDAAKNNMAMRSDDKQNIVLLSEWQLVE